MEPNDYKKKLEQVCEFEQKTPGAVEITAWKPMQCNDCGRVVQDQIRRQVTKLKVSGWRERCINCNHVRSPETGKFDLPFGEITSEHKRQIATLRYHLKKQSRSTESCPNESKCDSAVATTDRESPESLT